MHGRDTVTVLVTGPPGSGKSSVAAGLRRGLGWPVLAKDLFKETLFDVLGSRDRAWSQELGIAALELLVRTSSELAATGTSHVLDVNFIRARDETRLARLLDGQGVVVHVRCSAALDVLEQRFITRATSASRHPGHVEGTQIGAIRQRLEAREWDVELPCLTVELDTGRLNEAAASSTALAALCASDLNGRRGP